MKINFSMSRIKYKEKFVLMIIEFIYLFLTVARCSAVVQTRLNQMESSRFGRMLQQTLLIQLEAKDPFESILHSLREIEASFQEQKSKVDQTQEETARDCDAKKRKLQADISEAAQQLILVTQRMKEVQQIVGAKQQVLADKEKEAQSYKDQQADLAGFRQDELSLLERMQQEAEVKEAFDILSEARRLISEQNRQPQQALSSNKQILSQLKSELSETAKYASKLLISSQIALESLVQKSFSPIFKILATATHKLSENPTDSSYAALDSLFSQLLEKISETQSQLRFQLEEKLAIGNKILRALENNIDLAKNEINEIQSSVQSYLNQLEIEEQQRNDLQEKIESKSRILKAKEDGCIEAEEDYKVEREQLEESRLIVSELLGILESDARSVREYFVKQGKLIE